MATATLPLFHLYGDPPDDQAFDFIHIETIASRSSIHDWTIRAHRHRNLFQILLIGSGGGEMTFEAASIAFQAPCAILVPATIAHGFRFQPALTDGWVISFTEDVAEAMGDRRGEALARLKALAGEPVVPLGEVDGDRLLKRAVELHEERFLARAGNLPANQSLRRYCSHGLNASFSLTSTFFASRMNLSIALIGLSLGFALQKSNTSLRIFPGSTPFIST
jgi:AraC family transcriptional activator of pobA